jgi:hypothetical protein
MARQQSQGTCYLCKDTFPKASMTRHLTKCLTIHDSAEMGSERKAKKGKLFRLIVEGKYQPQYWLHLEIPATATLQDLDDFLRHIWVECCDHLSAFKIEGQKRRPPPSLKELLAADPRGWGDPDEVDMEDQVGNIFKKDMKLSYEYDFGSTTHLSLKVVGEREGSILKPNEVQVRARNDPPHIPCGRCRQAAATIIDMENSYDESGWLCARCAEEMELSEEEMTLPVVNSPRTGVCGYTGD